MKRSLIVALLLAACTGKVRGVDSSISVNPTALVFAQATVGAVQELPVQIINQGTAELGIQGVKVSADPNAELAVANVLAAACDGSVRSGGMVLDPGECGQFVVRWKPGAAHDAAGSIEVDSDDRRFPVITIPVSGSATGPELQICALKADGSLDSAKCTGRTTTLTNVPEVDFDPGAVGTKSTRLVRVLNHGSAALQLLSAPHLAAGSPADFSVAPLAAGPIAPGASLDIPVYVTPSGTGPLQGALELTTNDPVAGHVSVPLVTVLAGYKFCVSPTVGLDFGSLTVGQAQTQTITFSNCGDVAFDITHFALSGSSTFTVPAAQLPATPSTLQPGGKFSLDVSYKPAAAQHDTGSIDATLTVQGTPHAQSWALTGTGLTATGGGGGCPGAPTAKITATKNEETTPFDPSTTILAPLDTVTLDGSTSTVPNGHPAYTWRLVSSPPGANDPLSSGTGVQTSITPRQDGDYVAELTVKDGSGCVSAPVQVTLHVKAGGAVHIELTWKESYGDVDLHYIGPGASFYQHDPIHGDLYWDESQYTATGTSISWNGGGTPDWGLNNTVQADGKTDNDAYLDVDQLWGSGPENITHAKPFDGTYQIKVHYYCPHRPFGSGDSGSVTPTLRIWINGVLLQQTPPTTTMTKFQVWEPATIVVSNNGQSVVATYANPAPHADSTPGSQNCDHQY